MNMYLWVKLVHVVSATLLFGTGIGSAFFMLRTYLSRNDEAMRITARNVVIADWLFTAPAVVIQFASGLWLTAELKIAYDSAWFVAVVSLYALAGACWIPVVWLQIRVRDMAAAGQGRESYVKLMRLWMALGVPAFASVLVIFFLMISKLGAYD
jgi:uncharacterized membrane protein